MFLSGKGAYCGMSAHGVHLRNERDNGVRQPLGGSPVLNEDTALTQTYS